MKNNIIWTNKRKDKLIQCLFYISEGTLTSIKSFNFFTLAMKIDVLLELTYKIGCVCVFYIYKCRCEYVGFQSLLESWLKKNSVGISRSVLRLMIYQALYLRGLRINMSASSPCQVSSWKSISIPMSLKINRKGM